MALDSTDIKILNILQNNGRITNSKLASLIGFSPPATLERVKRLELSGVISTYTAIVDRTKTGFDLLAFIVVSLSYHQISDLELIKKQLIQLDEVLECYQMTGDVDFLLKVATRNMASYKAFVNDKLSGIPGIQNIKTSFVLDTLKSNTALHLKEKE